MNSNLLKINNNSSPSLRTLRNGKKINTKSFGPKSPSSKANNVVFNTEEIAEISAIDTITTSLAVLSTHDNDALSLDDFLIKNNMSEHIEVFNKNKINTKNIVNFINILRRFIY